MIKFIHTADLHLDTPFSGLAKLDSDRARLLQDANNKVFNNIVDLCIREEVDFLTIAGDVFDASEQSLEARLSFVRGLRQLEKHNIKAFVASGNHDPLTKSDKQLTLPENTILFPADKPETHLYYSKSDEPLASVTGISHGNVSEKNNLARLFPEGNPDLPSIAVLHGNLSNDTSHDPYAPFRLEDLLKPGIDYWALGHIHKRQVLKDSDPAVIYPGNPQGRHFNETGEKGCYIVRLEKGKEAEYEFKPCMNALFDYLEIDVKGTEQWEELYDKIADTLKSVNTEVPAFIRIKLTGRTALHAELQNPQNLESLLKELEDDLEQDNLYPDKITINTSPDVDLQEREKSEDFTGEVLKAFSKIQQNPEELEALIDKISEDMRSARLPNNVFPPALSDEDKIAIADRARWMFYEQFKKSG